jgi:hypothetical protein
VPAETPLISVMLVLIPTNLPLNLLQDLIVSKTGKTVASMLLKEATAEAFARHAQSLSTPL